LALQETKEYRIEVPGSDPITVEHGRMAGQADGAVTVYYGDTVMLATACVSDEPREGVDFLPFRVDYEERQYAIGRIPGSFFRREGKPTDQAILSARLIDRPFRPLFPSGYRRDLQVVTTVLSYDEDHSPEMCAILGASLALNISQIPIPEPIAAAKVGLVDGAPKINPSDEELEQSPLDLVVAGTEDAIVMVEASAAEASEDAVLEAILAGHEAIKKMVQQQNDIIAEVGKPKEEFEEESPPEILEQTVRDMATDRLREALRIGDKEERRTARKTVRTEVQEKLAEEFPEQEGEIDSALDEIEKTQMRDRIVREGVRPDGREPNEIRPITCEVGVLPRVHGSGLFTRGETQVLTVAALGSVGDRQLIDSLGADEELKRYLHHYNFPPYSTGETRPLFAPGRREIGHGILAEKALRPVLPDEDEFPYTLRLVSEVLSSNGSSSMASVCGSSLALMDAGVQITRPVAGVAMGLIKEDTGVMVLSDILGLEDHLGDMDFKVAGTREGITVIQMDIKISGVDRAVLSEALERAHTARMFILDKMYEAIPEPRAELSRLAPRIISLKVDPSKIRHIIGPGGKTINSMIDELGVDIDVQDDGTVFIASEDGESGQAAQERIERLTAEAEVGKIYKGEVKRIVDKLGAFVEILPNQDGLVHISELDSKFVDKVESVVSVGDEVMVKLTEVDDLGRLNLSRQAVIEEMGREEVDSKENRNPGKSDSGNDKRSRGRGGGRGKRNR